MIRSQGRPSTSVLQAGGMRDAVACGWQRQTTAGTPQRRSLVVCTAECAASLRCAARGAVVRRRPPLACCVLVRPAIAPPAGVTPRVRLVVPLPLTQSCTQSGGCGPTPPPTRPTPSSRSGRAVSCDAAGATVDSSHFCCAHHPLRVLFIQSLQLCVPGVRRRWQWLAATGAGCRCLLVASFGFLVSAATARRCLQRCLCTHVLCVCYCSERCRVARRRRDCGLRLCRRRRHGIGVARLRRVRRRPVEVSLCRR
jgi:hypothetical protein